MKLALLILLLTPVALVGVDQEKSTPPAEKKGRLTLPADAEKIDAYTHRHKDKEGKVWIYRQTPFGLVRYEEPGQAAGPGEAPRPAVPATDVTGIRAFDQGDTVKFEKDGPFGKYTWVRKKTELNEDEKAALQAAEKKTSEKKPQQE